MPLSGWLFALTLLVAPLALAVPDPLEAQGVLDRIKKNASKKVEERKTAAEDSLVSSAAKMVDSTVEKTGRGVDATMNKVVEVADTVMNRTERGISSAASSLTGGGTDRIASDLADDGRAVIREIEWASGTAQPTEASSGVIERIAKAIAGGGTASVFLIEAHLADAGDPAAAHALSTERANAIKAQLMARGIDASRIFAMGLGATRPPADDGAAERIEIARMQ